MTEITVEEKEWNKKFPESSDESEMTNSLEKELKTSIQF